METKRKSAKVVVSLLALVGLLVFSLFAVGGSLEPGAPPGPTMKTLDEISAQIAALSSPINNVIRGVIDFPLEGSATQSDTFSPTADPNRSVVLLSDAVGNSFGGPWYSEWIARNGACLISLTESEITIQVESQASSGGLKVSYQIIEYK